MASIISTSLLQTLNGHFCSTKTILGFKPLCKSEGSAYFLARNPDTPGCLWFSLNLDGKAVRRPSPCNTHFAFSVHDGDFEALCQRITQSGAKVFKDNTFKDNTSPGKSLYFLNTNDDKLEIHVGDGKSRINAKKANHATGKMWSDVYDENGPFKKPP